jgi:hypothetical protein
VGFLEGNGTLGPAKHKAFAAISDTKDVDRRLRFHKTCPAYKVSFLISRLVKCQAAVTIQSVDHVAFPYCDSWSCGRDGSVLQKSVS